MNTVRQTLAVAWKELQVTLRDRGLLAVLFILPLTFGSLFSLLNQQSAEEEGGFASITFEVFVVNEDRGNFGAQTAEILRGMDMLEVLELDSASEANRRVGEGERTAAFIIPSDFTERINGYEPTAVEVVVDPVQEQIAGILTGLANFAASPASIQGELQYGVNDFFQESGLLQDAPPEAMQAAQAQTVGAIMAQMQGLNTNPPIGVVEENLKAEEPQEELNFFNLFMPAFAVMFAFFLIGHIGQSFHKERDAGTFRRLLASPLSRFSLVAGPSIAYTIMVVLQVLFLFGFGAAVFGMELGDRPLLLLVVTLALGLTSASLGLLLGAVTRNGNQADTVGNLFAFVVPFIGGIFAFGSYTPGYMTEGLIGTISPYFPHMHAAEGFRMVMEGVGTTGDILAEAGYLLIFAAIFFAIARWRLRFT